MFIIICFGTDSMNILSPIAENKLFGGGGVEIINYFCHKMEVGNQGIEYKLFQKVGNQCGQWCIVAVWLMRAWGRGWELKTNYIQKGWKQSEKFVQIITRTHIFLELYINILINIMFNFWGRLRATHLKICSRRESRKHSIFLTISRRSTCRCDEPGGSV